MSKSKIEWTDRVWNPVTGCTKVSQGCKNCYAETMAKRFWTDRKFTDVQYHPDRLQQPLRWKKPSMVFVNSMSDLFHESVPFDFIDDLFAVMDCCRKHTFQILTKRPERALEYFSENRSWRVGDLKRYFDSSDCDLNSWPLENVWIGVSVEESLERIPILLQIPAAVRFISCEPLLGPVNLNIHTETHYIESLYGRSVLNGNNIDLYGGRCNKIDWVICGGESGPKARPMHPDWARSLRDQCQSAKVPFLFKQWGEWMPVSWQESEQHFDKGKTRGSWHDGEFHTKITGTMYENMAKVGKKAAGRLLDGVEWSQYPEVKK